MAEHSEAQDQEGSVGQLLRFQEITAVDTETALQYLDACQWNIDVAVDRYFSGAMTSSSHDAGSKTKPITIFGSPGETPSSTKLNGSHDNPSKASCPMKLLSWNIDGLCQEQIKERTKYVGQLIKTRLPDVVYLQEVVEGTLGYFSRALPEYLVLHPDITKLGYFNIVLLRQASVKPSEELHCKYFSTSRMGRHLLIQPAQFDEKINVILMTSHLESTKDCHRERKNQLQQVFEEISSQDPEHLVIFGGDTNLRDSEVKAVGLPSHIEDMWEKCGSQDSTKYTWDTSINDNLHMQWNSKLRFDRIYLRPGARNSLVPSDFSLVGKERLASGCFPSDHWGIWCEFKAA